MMSHIFLSYSSEDKSKAIKIINILADNGFKVWYDRNLPAGKEYVTQIDIAAKESAAIVVLWSENSIKSSYVISEAIEGLERGVLLPIFLQNEVKPPIPLTSVQGLTLFDADENILKSNVDTLILSLNNLVREHKLDNTQTSGVNIVDVADNFTSFQGSVKEAVSAAENLLEPRIQGLREIANQLHLSTVSDDLQHELTRIKSTDFKVVVVGRMKTGKSTLLNGLLGSPLKSNFDGDLLPTDDMPCTAVLSYLTYAPQPRVTATTFDKQVENWSFAEYTKTSTIYSDDPQNIDANTEKLKRIEKFEIGWPSELLKNGVILIDSPGISDHPERTVSAQLAVKEADAAIFMFRHDVLAGQDEIHFAYNEVMPRAGKVFTLVNLWAGRTPDDTLRSVTYHRLGLQIGTSSEENNLFFVDVLRGRKAQTHADMRELEVSGFKKFQIALSDFLLNEKLATSVNKVLKEASRTAINLDLHIQNRRTTLLKSVEEVKEALRLCSKDIDLIRKRYERVIQLVDATEKQAISIAKQSLTVKVAEIAQNIPERFYEASIPELGNLESAIKSKGAVNKAVSVLNKMIEQELTDWVDNTPPEAGFQKDLQSTIDNFTQSVEYEVEEIFLALQSIRLRLANLAQISSDSEDILHGSERIAASVAGHILLGPIGGIVGVGGFRSLGGGIAGGVLALVLIKAMALALGPLALAAAVWGAIFGGGILTTMIGLEKRIKSQAVKHFIPAFQQEMSKPEIKDLVEEGVRNWFLEIRKRLNFELEKIVKSESEAIDKLSNFEKDRENKVVILTDMEQLQQKLNEIQKELP